MVRQSECRGRREGNDGGHPGLAWEFLERRGCRSGVFEYKLDFGPGCRIYFGKDGETLVILLGGGTKRRQQRDINAALANWQDYKRRK